MKVQNITELIGVTPHLRLSKLFPTHEVWIKLEKQNPGGSIKDRIALAMIEDAENAGILKKGAMIIEPTSGNTGVGLAMVAAAKGYKVILTMPESMSLERRKIMKTYGAELVLTPKEKGMNGAISKAAELVSELENAWMPQQFENASNPETHRKNTAQEVINDFDSLDYFISGVGTGGHITGMGETLKGHYKNLKVLAVEPENSPVIAGGNPGPHPIQGIGAGFIPTNLNTDILDGSISISKEEAFEMAQEVARTEGLFVGISTGASLAAVKKQLATIDDKAVILTVNYDTGERYLSVDGLF